MILYITIASIFLVSFLIIGTLLYPLLTRRSAVQQRLDKLVPRMETYTSARLVRERTPLQAFLAKIGELMPVSPSNRSKYAQYLVAAGYHKENVLIFIASKLILALLLPILFMFFVSLPKGMILDSRMLLLEVALAIVGFLLPSFWLQRKVDFRKNEIFHTLPDILDLMTICVVAGISIDSAIVKASENPQFRGNPLAEELKQASMEVRAGKPRSEALKDMAERTMVDDLKSFVTMLVQTERFGTSLSQALKVHSDSLRTKRRQIAEESAAKTAVKMLFPLVFFIFPAMLVVTLGPALISMFKAFK
jgi:tight adherence protein C